MPCKDVTDTIKIFLYANNRLLDYSLVKRECASEAGYKSLLLPFLKNKNIQEILSFKLKDLCGKCDASDFLLNKHFNSLITALEVFSGEETGAKNNNCQIDFITYNSTGVEFLAYIKNNISVKNIAPCSGHGGKCLNNCKK